MTFNFDEEIDRRHSDSRKWNAFAKDVLPMWVADMDFRSPDCIVDALRQRIEHGVFGYGNTPYGLIDVIIERMARRYQWHIKPEWIVFLPGVVTGLNLSVRAFCQPNEATIAPTPIYPPFRHASALAGCHQRLSPLKKEQDRWVIDLAALEEHLQGNERLLMLCNPQNPGGTVYRREELEQQLEFASRHDLIVCSDEIHCELILAPDRQHIPFASLSEEAGRRSITLISPSKSFNIAGLGASCAIIPDASLRKKFNATREGIVPAVDILALSAAEAAWKDGDDWLARLLVYLRHNRDTLSREINALPGLSMVSPEATYLAWIDASGLGLDNPARWFRQAGLGFSPGAEFGEPQFIRLNFGCRAALLDSALSRMRQAIDGLR